MIKLPRLPQNTRLVNSDGTPTGTFQQWWQQVVKQVETSINGIQSALDAAGIAQAAAATAQSAADAAQTAATNANTAAQASDDATALANSYPTGLTPPVATDTGADVTITIAAHSRVYPYASGNVTVAVSGGTITGQPYSTGVYIYYHDAARTGGAVTYLASTNPTAVAQVGDVHSIGAVTTPAAAAPPSSGNVLRPRGYVEP